MAKCEETPFISAGGGGLMTRAAMVGGGAVDQPHLSVFMTGLYFTWARPEKGLFKKKTQFPARIPKRYRQQLHIGLDNFFWEGEAILAFTTQCVSHAGHPTPLCLEGIKGAMKGRL